MPDESELSADGAATGSAAGGRADAVERGGAGAIGPWLGVLVFGFGTAAGFLIAFSGLAFLEESAGVIVLVFLSAVAVVSLLGLMLVAARRPLLRRVFGYAEVHIERLAQPIGQLAERAIERDPTGVTAAARELMAMALARYAWLTARRWVVASLTALIAAMAALAGTALLFKQNQLLAVQSDLLREQNARIQEQTVLLSQDVQLAEAARNAELAVEITGIAARLGAALDAGATAGDGTAGASGPQLFAYVDPNDLPRELILRITSISRATKPYLFLDLGAQSQDANDMFRHAMLRRRDDLPKTYERMAAAFAWPEPEAGNRLIDRPASPERGQLLTVLLGAGIHNLEALNFAGLDLSFAYLPNADISILTAIGGRMAFADFSGSYFTEADLGGAAMENARFRNTQFRRSTFAAVEGARVREPYRADGAPYSTFLTGADFDGSVHFGTDFTGAALTAASFDGALLMAPDFTSASLGAATFRGAVLVAPVWAGADLKSADLDGALIYGDDPLGTLARTAAPGTFVADRYRAEPVDTDAALALNVVYRNVTADEIAALGGGAGGVRLVRTEPFEP